MFPWQATGYLARHPDSASGSLILINVSDPEKRHPFSEKIILKAKDQNG